MMEKSSLSKSYIIIILINCIVGALLASLSVMYGEIHPDIGSQLPTGEFLYQGGRWYRDIMPSHLSSFMPLLAIVRSWVGEFLTYELVLMLSIAIQLLSSLVLGVIARTFGFSLATSALAGSLCFLLLLLSEGWHPMTEVYAALFSLLAFWVYACLCKRRLRFEIRGESYIFATFLFLVGILSGIGFTFKQYALVTIVSFALAEKVASRADYRSFFPRQISLALGFFAVIGAYYGAIAYQGEVRFDRVLWDIMGGWYEKRYWLFPQYLFDLFMTFPGVLLALGGITVAIRQWTPCYIALVLLALSNLAPGLVRPYSHYFHLVIPYLVLLAFLFFGEYRKTIRSSQTAEVLMLGILFVVPMYSALQLAYSLATLDLKATQIANSAHLKSAVQGKDNILNLCNPMLNHLLRLSPITKELGYAFLDNRTEGQLRDGLAKADYVLTVGDWYNIYLSHGVLYNVHPTLSSEFEPYYEVPSPPGMSADAKFSSLVCKVWKRRLADRL